MRGGFGTAGIPNELIDGLIAQGAKDLTVVNNNAGNGDTGLAALLKTGRVRKIICSFPRQADSHVFDGLYRDHWVGMVRLAFVMVGDLVSPRERGRWMGVLMAVFRMSEDQAYRVMMTAHRRGACVVAAYTRDVAESKATEAMNAGRQAGHPLEFTTEPEE